MGVSVLCLSEEALSAMSVLYEAKDSVRRKTRALEKGCTELVAIFFDIKRHRFDFQEHLESIGRGEVSLDVKE